MRRALAAAALALGVAALIAGEPRPPRTTALDAARLAAEVENEQDHVTARELAAWIRGRKPGLRVIDVRSAEAFERGHLPAARRMSLESLVAMAPRRGETLVLYSAGGAHAAQAWVLLRASGHDHVYFLRGGLQEWSRLLAADRELYDYFGPVAGGGVENGGC